MDTLPEDILMRILSYFNGEDTVRATGFNHYFHDLITSNRRLLRIPRIMIKIEDVFPDKDIWFPKKQIRIIVNRKWGLVVDVANPEAAEFNLDESLIKYSDVEKHIFLPLIKVEENIETSTSTKRNWFEKRFDQLLDLLDNRNECDGKASLRRIFLFVLQKGDTELEVVTSCPKVVAALADSIRRTLIPIKSFEFILDSPIFDQLFAVSLLATDERRKGRPEIYVQCKNDSVRQNWDRLKKISEMKSQFKRIDLTVYDLEAQHIIEMVAERWREDPFPSLNFGIKVSMSYPYHYSSHWNCSDYFHLSLIKGGTKMRVFEVKSRCVQFFDVQSNVA